ncbi:MAG: transglycosylase SLT domain-containing protein [Candidatus Atribacteria bacterium]|nr:transglycosylase SLT domain-containing protein [Candidatus Atribacteria bacterium]MBE3092306.1 transglycosylase SLT domain-containing protein [Chloroflexota bacterium]
MSNEKNKGEKNDTVDSFREKINKNLGLLVLIFMFLLIILFITLQISINNLSTQTEKYVENINLNNEKIGSINEKIVSIEEDLFNEIKKYNQAKIGRDEFTEIYMQLQELTGMISNEVKREYYITRTVNDISKNNSTLDSKSIYEISKTIYEESVKYNFNPLLITAIIKTESNYQPTAVSDSYAYGLCQVRKFIAPELAENIGIKWDGAEKTLFDPIKNIQIGVYYLSILNRDFNDLHTAVIAYNLGPYAVQERLTNNQELPDDYLNKVLDYYANLRGFSLEEIQNEIKATE